jgi:DNA-directed RNA polymerase subunit RPC12/RpoP
MYATICDICSKEFLTSKDRNIEHNHETGEIRGIVCTKCNHHKKDRKISSLNTSGYKGISCIKHKNPKNGIQYRFNAYIDGKEKTIKSSVNLEWLIEFAENWKKENNYYT